MVWFLILAGGRSAMKLCLASDGDILLPTIQMEVGPSLSFPFSIWLYFFPNLLI